jgi:hypothetical protein
MSNSKFPQLAPTIFVTALLASCANPKRVDEVPLTLMQNGDRVASPTRAGDGAPTPPSRPVHSPAAPPTSAPHLAAARLRLA